MAAVKLVLWSCLVAVLSYFAYRELQVHTFSYTVNVHIPAKRSDVYHMVFDNPEIGLKIHPLCNGVSNIVRSQDQDGRKVVEFDVQERAVFLGFFDTGNFTFHVTTTELKENTATQMRATMHMIGGMVHVHINQGFHFSDSEEGGTWLEDTFSHTARCIIGRVTSREAYDAHVGITENIKKYFVGLESQQAQST